MQTTEDFKSLSRDMASAPRFVAMGVIADDPRRKDVDVHIEVSRADGGVTTWIFQVYLDKDTNTVIDDSSPQVAFFGGDFETETDVPESVTAEYMRVLPEAKAFLAAKTIAP